MRSIALSCLFVCAAAAGSCTPSAGNDIFAGVGAGTEAVIDGVGLIIDAATGTDEPCPPAPGAPTAGTAC